MRSISFPDLLFFFEIYLPFVILRERGLYKRLANFFYKKLDSKYLGFVGHAVSVETTHLCHFSTKATIDNTKKNEHGYVEINTY